MNVDKVSEGGNYLRASFVKENKITEYIDSGSIYSHV